jgi:hypothetical protein
MKNGKEPAFAAMNEQEIFFGLTKREYFAAKAMQGLLANSKITTTGNGNISKLALLAADALLTALEQPQP